MTKEEKDKILKAIVKDRNDYASDCQKRIEREFGKIEGADYMLQRFLDVLRTEVELQEEGINKSTVIIGYSKELRRLPFCIYTSEEKKYIGYCNTSDEDYYCKVLKRFMEYDKVDGGLDILGKPIDCPLQAENEEKEC